MSKTSGNDLLEVFIDSYGQLRSYLKRHFGRHDFVDDVLQDVGLQLISNPLKEPVTAPLAFLRRMAFNRSLDRCRSNERWARFDSVECLPPEELIYDPALDGDLDIKQHLMELAAIIKGLPDRARQVFLLHRIHGMSQQAIADEIGISRNMVVQHYARALKEIAEKLVLAQRLQYRNLAYKKVSSQHAET